MSKNKKSDNVVIAVALFGLLLLPFLPLLPWIIAGVMAEFASKVDKGIKYIEAQQGDVGAQYRLGSIYDLQEGDWAAAAKWYQKAADQGDTSAPGNLGFLYARGGHGIERDYATALKWYRQIADTNPEAQFEVGELYETGGPGLNRDYIEAAKWYHKAADHGLVRAQFRLGELYESGNGVKRNYAAAAALYRKVAETGDGRAQHNLGRLYASGRGLKQDYAEAYFWCTLAEAAAVNRVTSDDKRMSAEHLTPEQRTAVDVRISTWKPNPILLSK